ncbi:HSP20-like chaperones superfamily protein [Perilla frutescens var. hirtella]|nr:HSP20-like chaperones superfamily protein [Perilla frutescens var. hirtella]
MVRSNTPSSEGAAANARVDWKETVEAYLLKVDVPGFKKEDVKIEVEDGKIVRISGERSKDLEEREKDKWYCMERGGGKFLRRFSLPENARLDRMKVAMENGVLTVTVPTKGVNEKPEVKVVDVSS